MALCSTRLDTAARAFFIHRNTHQRLQLCVCVLSFFFSKSLSLSREGPCAPTWNSLRDGAAASLMNELIWLIKLLALDFSKSVGAQMLFSSSSYQQKNRVKQYTRLCVCVCACGEYAPEGTGQKTPGEKQQRGGGVKKCCGRSSLWSQLLLFKLPLGTSRVCCRATRAWNQLKFGY